MRRVLHVVQTLTGGGAETLVRNLAPRLSLRGFEVGIVAIYRIALDQKTTTEIRSTLFELGKKSRFDVFPFLRLLGIIKQFRPAIVHAHTYAGKYWGRAAAAICGVPCVLTEHGIAYRTGILEKTVSRFLDRRTAVSVVFSDATAKVAADESRVRDIRIIPNGIPMDNVCDRQAARTALGCASDELAVVSVGRLYSEKAPQVALQAMRMLPSELLARTRLHWIGDGPLLEASQSLKTQLGLEQYVVFHGFRHDARNLLAGADLALSSSRIEAAPVWLIEAMAAGVPVVATPTLGARDLIADQETGLIAESNDAHALAKALSAALSDESWRRSASSASQRRAKRYDIERVADAYAMLYTEVIERCGSPT